MLRPIGPSLEYIMNYDYISKVLCINKEKPQLKCDGKCYLSQKIKKQKNNVPENMPEIDLSKYPIGFVEFLKISSGLKNLRHEHNFENLSSVPNGFNNSCFHPPDA